MNDQFRAGISAALARFKLANAGCAPPMGSVNTQSTGASMSPPSMNPPTSAAPPIAAGAIKAKVLG